MHRLKPSTYRDLKGLISDTKDGDSGAIFRVESDF